MKQKTKKRVAVAGAVLGTTLAGALLARKVLRGRTALEHLAETPLLRGPTEEVKVTPPTLEEQHLQHIREAQDFLKKATELKKSGINLRKSKDLSKEANLHLHRLHAVGGGGPVFTKHGSPKAKSAWETGIKIRSLFPHVIKPPRGR